MALTVDAVRWVAHLSRLELSDGELESITQQLSPILAYVNQLQQLATDDVLPLAHPLPVHNVFRDDLPTESLSVELALANAPERRGDLYSVPAVLE